MRSTRICLKTKMRVCGCPKIVITSDRGARDKRKTRTMRKLIGKKEKLEKNSSLSRLSSHISIFGLVFFKLKSQSRKLCSFVFKALGPCERLKTCLQVAPRKFFSRARSESGRFFMFSAAKASERAPITGTGN